MPIPDDTDTETDVRDDIKDALAEQGVELPAPDSAQRDGADSGTGQPSEADRALGAPVAEEPSAPVSFSPTAKAAVEKLKSGVALNPSEAKELAVALDKREREINNGFAKLKEFKGLEEYAQQYSQQGLSVRQVLDGYHHAERVLRKDFLGGLEGLMERYRIDPRAVSAALAQKYGGAAPHGQPQSAGMSAQEREAVVRLQAHAQGLEATVQKLSQQVQAQRARDVARDARTAGSSITGGPSATPPASEPDSDNLRALLERNFVTAGGRV